MAGAAGLSAASMSSYMGLKTVIFEGGSWGGLLSRFCPDKLIDNYPGLTDKITPLKLIDSLLNDAKKQHIDLKQEYVNELENEQFKTLRADSGTYKVKIVVLASGSYPEKSGFVQTDKYQKTNIPGVYAIGNVTSDIDLLVVAEAHGAIVAHDAYKKLRLS